MSKFNQLMEKEHVRNHPMFRGFDDRLKAARERLSRKSAAPDLRDVFSSQKAVGLGTNDRSVRAYIQEAALSARSVLDMCEFPMLPQISFNNVKSVKMAAHDDSQVVDAEILFNVRICTKSGAIRQALIPVVVSRGVVVPPSTLIYDQQMKVIAQSTIDEIVQRNTSYQLPPMRRMYDPPLRGEELDRAASERNTLGWMPREVVTDGMGIRHSRREAAFESYAMSLTGQDQTNPGTPSSLAGQPPAGVTQSDATQLSNPATDPTMAGVPGGEKTPYGQYAESGSATDSLYRQILAQPTIMQQVQDILTPSRETLIDNISQMISPMMSVLGLRTEDVEWDFLLDDLKAGLGGTTASKIGKAEVRKVALMIAEYATGRRRFGRRRAAADTATALAEMTTYLQSAQDTFKPDELAYYQQIAQEAQSALQGGDEQTARDLLVELENAFSFTDVPQEQEVPTDYWQTFTANCKKLAQQTNLVKELEVDEDDNRPMKRYMPAGYDLVLEDMVKAEEGGLDTFPRPYSHIERNYILRRYPTCSRDKWLPHLINDGFALNPYGKGPNRGRPVREGSKKAGQAPNIIANLGDVNYIDYGGLLIVDNGGGPQGWLIEVDDSDSGGGWQWEKTAKWMLYRFDIEKFKIATDESGSYLVPDSYQPEWGPASKYEEWFADKLGDVAGSSGLPDQDLISDLTSDDPVVRGGAYREIIGYFGAHEFDSYPETYNAKEIHALFGEEYHGGEDEELEEEPEEGFGEEPEAPIEPKLSRSAQMDDEGEEESWEPNVRAKKDLRTSDGDRIKAGTGGFLMWARGDMIEVLVPPSIQDSFKREDWEDIGPVSPRSAQNEPYPGMAVSMAVGQAKQSGGSEEDALRIALESPVLKGVPRDQVAEMIRKEWSWEPKSSTPSTGGPGSLDDEFEEEDEIDPNLNPVIYLDNMDHEDGMVTVHIADPRAGEFAENDQSIQGSNWESDGPDFAYAIIMDSPTLVEDLKKDGYNVNDDEYYPMTAEELQALDPMNR